MVISNPIFAEWMRVSTIHVPVIGRDQHHIHQNISSYTAISTNTIDTYSEKLHNISTYQMCLEPGLACWL